MHQSVVDVGIVLLISEHVCAIITQGITGDHATLIDLALNPQFTLVTASIFDYIQILKESCRLALATGRIQTAILESHTYICTCMYDILTVPNAQPCCSHVHRVTIA